MCEESEKRNSIGVILRPPWVTSMNLSSGACL